MLPKPDTCKPCPLYGDGVGFTPDSLPAGSELAILAQNPGKDEEEGNELQQYVGKNRVYVKTHPQPLIGATGYSLKREFIPRANLTKPVALLNVLKCRLGHKNDMPKGQMLKDAVACCSQYLELPASVTHVVAHGVHAVNYTQGRPTKLKEWRGYQLPTYWKMRPVFATLHTALLFRAPKNRVLALKDWSKVGAWVRGTWPLPIPERLICPVEVATHVGLAALQRAVEEKLRIACDTEFVWKEEDVPGHHPLTMIGFAWRTPEGPITGVQFVQSFEAVLAFLHANCKIGRWVFQNAAADLPVIEYNGGPKREGWL